MQAARQVRRLHLAASAGLVFDDVEAQVGWAKPERLDFSRPDGPVLAHGYRLSFSVISLICQIVRDPFGGKFARPRAFRDVWVRVQPISKGEWPPARRIAASTIEDSQGIVPKESGKAVHLFLGVLRPYRWGW